MANFEEKIGKVIGTLFDGLMVSAEQETQKNFGNRIKEMVNENRSFFERIDEYDVIINYKLDNTLKACLKEVYPELDRHKINDLYFVYKNYRFLDNNLKRLISDKEGGGCSADKSHWIVSSYMKYIMTGIMPDMNIDEKCYWKPAFGTGQQWMNLCVGLESLHYGNPEKYLESMKALLDIKK